MRTRRRPIPPDSTATFGRGAWQILATRLPAVLAVAYRWRGGTVVRVHNFAAEAREVSLQLGGGLLSDLIEMDELTSRPDSTHPHAGGSVRLPLVPAR